MVLKSMIKCQWSDVDVSVNDQMLVSQWSNIGISVNDQISVSTYKADNCMTLWKDEDKNWNGDGER